MSPTKGPCTSSSIRKLKPRVRWPTAAALSGLSSSDIETLRRRLTEAVECVFDALFQRDDAESAFLGPLPQSPGHVTGTSAGSDDSGVDLLWGSTGRALTPDQERHLFLRLNYCRYRVMRVLRKYRGKHLSARATRELLRWEHRTRQTRGDIVRLNVALVLAMAKRTRLTGVDYADLVSEGNLALLRSVDKFDCSRGFKFSTYACRAILKSFSRVATRTARYRGYFPTEFDPTLEKGHHIEQKRQDVEEDCVDELKSILGENLAHLNDVERRVILARFAIDDDVDETDVSRAKTLEQVGEMIGVTKERVRQIQNKALSKLRLALEQGILAV
jgi:RNA polymerase primary sigma factor